MRRSLAVVTSFALTFIVSSRADAAATVGPSFFVADPHTDAEAFPAVTRIPGRFVVAWVTEGEAAFRRLNADGTLADPGSVVFLPHSTDSLGSHTFTSATAPVDAITVDHDVVFTFDRFTSGISSSAGSFTGYSPTWVVLPGAAAPSAPVTVSTSFFVEPTFASAALGSEWAMLGWSVESNQLVLTLRRGDANGAGGTTPVVAYPVTSNPMPSLPAGIGLASDGTGYLAVWAEGAVPMLCKFSKDGLAEEIRRPSGWTTSGSIRVASNGEGYLISWVDASRALRVAVIGSGGPADEGDGVVVATEVDRIVDLDAASESYLVAYSGGSDAGDSVRGARVSASGEVLDPGGFDLQATKALAVTSVSDGVWLLVYASRANAERTLLEARFVGAVVPLPPDNPVPPPSPREDGDGGAISPGGEDGGEPSSPEGGAAEDGGGSGGAPPTDTDGGAAAAGSGGAAPPLGISGGCGCKVALPSANHAGWLSLALALLAVRRREARFFAACRRLAGDNR